VLVQGSLFSTVSLASLAVFRKPLRDMVERRTPRAESIDTMIGETAIALADIAPGAVGKAELRGTAWSATNASADPIPASRRCRVDRVDGLMLFIRGSSQGE
jgi:membrane protein implicated in regulation of membrane protease activity